MIVSDNSRRLDKFATRTCIVEIDSKKVVYKTALTKVALPFLKHIIESERKNHDYLIGQFEVLQGILKGDRIEYEYLPFPSLQDTIGEHLCQGNHCAANKMFLRYVDRLKSLEKVQVFPRGFLRNFAGNTMKHNVEVESFSRGLVDLTPRNILVDGDRWIVLDNEWSFDFPIPIDFILFRAVKEMSFNLQYEIRKCTEEQNPAIGVFVHNFRSYYVPLDWMEYFANIDISFRQLLHWEMGFQKYVTGSPKNALGEIKARMALGQIKLFRRRKTQFSEWRKYKRERSTRKMFQTIKKIFGTR